MCGIIRFAVKRRKLYHLLRGGVHSAACAQSSSVSWRAFLLNVVVKDLLGGNLWLDTGSIDPRNKGLVGD